MFTLVILACLAGDCRNLVAQQPLMTAEQCATDYITVTNSLQQRFPDVQIVGAKCIHWKTGELTELKD